MALTCSGPAWALEARPWLARSRSAAIRSDSTSTRNRKPSTRTSRTPDAARGRRGALEDHARRARDACRLVEQVAAAAERIARTRSVGGAVDQDLSLRKDRCPHGLGPRRWRRRQAVRSRRSGSSSAAARRGADADRRLVADARSGAEPDAHGAGIDAPPRSPRVSSAIGPLPCCAARPSPAVARRRRRSVAARGGDHAGLRARPLCVCVRSPRARRASKARRRRIGARCLAVPVLAPPSRSTASPARNDVAARRRRGGTGASSGRRRSPSRRARAAAGRSPRRGHRAWTISFAIRLS